VCFYQKLFLPENETREYLVVLAGDPIYKMDYAEMLDFLLTKEAAAVVSALETSLNKVSRFGMLGVDEDHRILQWDESRVTRGHFRRTKPRPLCPRVSTSFAPFGEL
jgi:ADP-glucose pyrophosphorylase